MPQSSAVMAASAAHARAVQTGDPDQIRATRTALNEVKIQEWVRRTLADAPPNLTPATRASLARLLPGGDR